MKDTKTPTFLVILQIKLLLIRGLTLILLYAFFLIPTNAKAQDLRDLDHTLKFADYLFKTRQFVLASEEYERVVYYDSTNTTALLRLMQSYRYSEKYLQEKERFNYYFKDSLHLMRADFATEYVKTQVMLNDFADIYTYLDKNTTIQLGEKQTYQLGSLLLQKKWDDAFNYALVNKVTAEKKNADMHVLAFRSKELKYKKPFVAAMFSTIVPGTGKMYTKNWKDGVISLLFVGVNAWQAYRGFHKYGEKSAYGWVFAGIGTAFYIGNIFGSAKSAKKYNQKLDNGLYDETWHLMVDDL